MLLVFGQFFKDEFVLKLSLAFHEDLAILACEVPLKRSPYLVDNRVRDLEIVLDLRFSSVFVPKKVKEPFSLI